MVAISVPSMKVPPKRKGNYRLVLLHGWVRTLNESPSEKEGKLHFLEPNKG